MRNLIVLLLAAAASGAVFVPKAEWTVIESLVPSNYYKVIMNNEELYSDPSFLHKVTYIAVKNMKLFIQTLYARQNYLSRYVACSCPSSNIKYEPVVPYFWGLRLDFDTPTGELVKLHKEGMEFSKKMSDIVKMVSTECPLAATCLHKANDDFMDILTGKEDSMILDSLWQYYLPHFYPKLFEPLFSVDHFHPHQEKCSQFLNMFSTHPMSEHYEHPYYSYMQSLPYNYGHYNYGRYNYFMKPYSFDYNFPYMYDFMYQHPMYMNYRYRFNKYRPFDFSDMYHDMYKYNYDFYRKMDYKPYRYNFFNEFDSLDDFDMNKGYMKYALDKHPFDMSYHFFPKYHPMEEPSPSFRFSRSAQSTPSTVQPTTTPSTST